MQLFGQKDHAVLFNQIVSNRGTRHGSHPAINVLVSSHRPLFKSK
jgi:hypothetical protein